MPFVKVVIYVSTNPLLRISKCDILRVLNADEEAARIAGIYKKNLSKYSSNTQKQIDKKELDLAGLEYKFKLEFKSPIKQSLTKTYSQK